jgi:hypothetical protein
MTGRRIKPPIRPQNAPNKAKIRIAANPSGGAPEFGTAEYIPGVRASSEKLACCNPAMDKETILISLPDYEVFIKP